MSLVGSRASARVVNTGLQLEKRQQRDGDHVPPYGSMQPFRNISLKRGAQVLGILADSPGTIVDLNELAPPRRREREDLGALSASAVQVARPLLSLSARFCMLFATWGQSCK